MLTTEKIQEFKIILQEKQSHLQEELQKIATQDDDNNWTAKIDDLARDDETNAVEMADFTNTTGVVTTLSNDLDNIIAALSRIDNGTYGKCKSCAGYINPKRLEVLPGAKNCMECKQA